MTTTRKSSSGPSTSKGTTTDTSTSRDRRPRQASAPRAAPASRRASGARIAAEAGRQLLTMTGKQPEGISGLQRNDDGWLVQVEVLELSRIPNTTDILASYEVEMDVEGELQGYRRLRRYVRGVPGEE